MTKTLPWALLALYWLYKRTWGGCDCDGLRRRLNAAQRELHSYQYENLTLIKHHEEYHS